MRFTPLTGPWFAVSILLLAAHPDLAAGQVETFAGTGQKGFSGDGGPAKAAQLNNVFGIARGPDGALYVCDTDNQRVRRVDRDGTITTVAGNGTRGYSGDGGPATKASLNEPYEVRFDRTGDLYFVERLNHLVRKVDLKTGVISTVAGTGKPGFGGDGGPATRALFHEPHSIQFDAHGDLLVCDIRNHRLRKVDMRTGVITTAGGTGKGEATREGAVLDSTAALNGPRALDVDHDGNIWLALREGNAVYRVDVKSGRMHRVAGTGKKGYTGDGGPALDATLSGPKGISVARNGDVYIADTENHVIRRIDAERGTIETIVGTGQRGDGPDGDPLRCKLARPHAVFVDVDGSLFIGDTENHRVRVWRGRD
jgi:streptogramin lyase